jgi:MFS family permease
MTGRRPRRSAIPGQAVLIAIAVFAFIAATNILTPLLPTVRDDFGVSISVPASSSAHGLARLLVDLPAGFLADRVGHRRLSVIAIAARHELARRLGGPQRRDAHRRSDRQRRAVAILAMVGITALAATASVANRGRVMSMFHLANNFGIAFYPLLGGFVGAATGGWRETFLITAALAVVAGAIRSRSCHGSTSARERRPQRPPTSRVLHGRAWTTAMVATNLGIVANMVTATAYATIVPLYAAAASAWAACRSRPRSPSCHSPGCSSRRRGLLGDRIGRRRVIVAGCRRSPSRTSRSSSRTTS